MAATAGVDIRKHSTAIPAKERRHPRGERELVIFSKSRKCEEAFILNGGLLNGSLRRQLAKCSGTNYKNSGAQSSTS